MLQNFYDEGGSDVFVDRIDHLDGVIEDIRLYTFQNLRYIPRTEHTTKKEFLFPGKNFIIDLSQYQYFHVLHDKLAQYEFLKKYIPELNPVFVLHDPTELDYDYLVEKKFDRFHAMLEDPGPAGLKGSRFFRQTIVHVLESYDANRENIVFTYKDEIRFEEVVVFYTSQTKALNDLQVCGVAMHNQFRKDFDKFSKEALSGLRQRFAHYMVTDQDSPKKIFISRSDVNKRYYDVYRLRDMEKSGAQMSEEDISKLAQYKKEFTSTRVMDNVIGQRFGTLEMHRVAEETARNLGFEIIETSEMSLPDQIKLFYNATHAVVWDGTGAYNGVWMKRSAHAFILHEKHNYMWCYPSLLSFVTNVSQLPDEKTNHCIILPSDIKYLMLKYLSDDSCQ